MLTDGYRRQLEKMHADPDLKWGNDGKFHVNGVVRLAQHVHAKTILDFGCGRSTLSKTLKKQGHKFQCTDYDPGRPKKAHLPDQVFDMVVCTDVLEHIEPEYLSDVFKAISSRSGKAAYFVIDTVPAITTLPDGRNAHLIVQSASWWLDRLNSWFPSYLWFGLQEKWPKKLIAEFWTRG